MGVPWPKGSWFELLSLRNRVLVLDLREASRHRRRGAVDAGGPVGERLFQHGDVALQRASGRAHCGNASCGFITPESTIAMPIPGAVQPAVWRVFVLVGADVARQCAADGFERARRVVGASVRRDAYHVGAPRQRVENRRGNVHRQRMCRVMTLQHCAAGLHHKSPQIGHIGIGGVAQKQGLNEAPAVHVARPLDCRRCRERGWPPADLSRVHRLARARSPVLPLWPTCQPRRGQSGGKFRLVRSKRVNRLAEIHLLRASFG